MARIAPAKSNFFRKGLKKRKSLAEDLWTGYLTAQLHQALHHLERLRARRKAA